MAETRRKFDRDFKEGAVRLVRETGRPITQVARDLGFNEGIRGNWVNADRRPRGDGNGALGEDERAELARLRRENAELVMCSSARSPSGYPDIGTRPTMPRAGLCRVGGGIAGGQGVRCCADRHNRGGISRQAPFHDVAGRSRRCRTGRCECG
jgi:transposase